MTGISLLTTFAVEIACLQTLAQDPIFLRFLQRKRFGDEEIRCMGLIDFAHIAQDCWCENIEVDSANAAVQSLIEEFKDYIKAS